MSDDGHLTLPKTPSDTDSNSNSNSGSLFSRCYPDELSSSNSSGSKENTPSLSNNENSSSPKLLSHRAEPVPTVRQRLLKNLFSEGIKCQPKITHNDSIDLATAEWAVLSSASFSSVYGKTTISAKNKNSDALPGYPIDY
uniref:Uncharacterized protein n=1 Tax=Brugia malayi TaxID=6279 RepID=A8PJV2_BRUMA